MDLLEWDFIALIGDDKRYVRKCGVDATKRKLRVVSAETVSLDLPPLAKDASEKILAGNKI